MPDTYRVRYTPEAYSDLQEIFDYIKISSPQNAPEMIRKLMEAADSLDIFPHRYRPPRNMGKVDREIRSMPVPPFLMRYRIEEGSRAVVILSIRHGAREI